MLLRHSTACKVHRSRFKPASPLWMLKSLAKAHILCKTSTALHIELWHVKPQEEECHPQGYS